MIGGCDGRSFVKLAGTHEFSNGDSGWGGTFAVQRILLDINDQPGL